jgi:hypothetical protein
MLSKEYRQERKELVEDKREWKDDSKEAIDIAKNDSTFTKDDIKGLKKYCKEIKKDKKDYIKWNRKERVREIKNKFRLRKKPKKVYRSHGLGNGFGNGKVNYTLEQKKKYDSLINVVKNIDVDGDGIVDVEDDVMLNDVIVEFDNIIMVDNPPMLEDETPMPIRYVENMDIVDNTAGEDNNSSKGTIAYSVPKEMQVGKSYQIKLRITKEKGKEVNQTLVLGDREIPIADPSIDSRVTIENIRVEKTMTAELISENGAFEITPLNTEKQFIEDGEYTEWGWVVNPLKSGKTYLKLLIKIKIEVDGETSYKDIVVFDKNIEVKANIQHGVKNWFSEYWQWLMTTIIIPVVVFFYKKREKKKQEEKSKN